MLTFDPVAHVYHYEGRRVPNVTSVLSSLTDYSSIPERVLDVARARGIAVHKMVELWCKDDLDENNLPGWMLPVLEKWIEFVKHTGFTIIASEHRCYHPAFGYAGTLDLFGHLKHEGAYALIDLKRSFFAGDAIGLQLAAYLCAYAEEEPRARNARRYAMRLHESQPMRLQQFTDPRQTGEFVALLTAQRIQNKYRKEEIA